MSNPISNYNSSSIETTYPISLPSSDKGKEEDVSEVLENQTTIPNLNEDATRIIFGFAAGHGYNKKTISQMRLVCRAWHYAVDEYVLKPCWIAMTTKIAIMANEELCGGLTLRNLITFVNMNACSIDNEILIKLFVDNVIHSALTSSSDEANALDTLSNSVEPLKPRYFNRFSHLTHELRMLGAPISKKNAVLGFRDFEYLMIMDHLDSAVQSNWRQIDPWLAIQGLQLEIARPRYEAQSIRAALNLPANLEKIARVTELHLSSKHLRTFFPEMGKFSCLRVLKLSRNSLESLPKTIGNLSLLTELEINENQLKSLTSKIGCLFQLTKLHLSRNQLESLPETIGNLTQLTSLDISSNRISQLPASIGNLTQLTNLDICSNRISQLPASIGNLAQLTRLNARATHLTELPSALGNLTGLTSMDLSYNFLTSLPKELSKLSRLNDFDLTKNQLIFTLDKNFDEVFFFSLFFDRSCNLQKMLQQQSACSTYQCASPLASLCQEILLGSDESILRQGFHVLSGEMQKLIYQQWSDIFSPPISSSEGGEDLLFAHAKRELFATTVIYALRKKWNALSGEQHQKAYARIAILAGHPQADAQKGKALAEENIIRFIDAMEFVTSGS